MQVVLAKTPLAEEEEHDLYRPVYKGYSVQRIDFPTIRQFMTDFHYARGMANNTSGAFGLFDGDDIIGGISFNTPISENVRSAVFGEEMKENVIELSRLCILDVTPQNTESWFIAQAMKGLRRLREDLGRPPIYAVVTFSDPSFGHVGTVYQASNSLYTGRGRREAYFIDEQGRRRPDRICGKNISRAEGEARGWTWKMGEPKHRYVFLRPETGQHRAELIEQLRLDIVAYPKPGVTSNGYAGNLCLW